MDIAAIWHAGLNLYQCMSAQYPNLKVLGAGVAAIIGGATLIFRLTQTQRAGILNSVLPPALQTGLTGLGKVVEKLSLNLK